MELEEVVSDIANGLSTLDAAGSKFREFQPGVGPFGEPQLVKQIAVYLNTLAKYDDAVQTKRCPDLLIPNEWAIEVKIARPYGDNGKEAENWSPKSPASLSRKYKFNRRLLQALESNHSRTKSRASRGL